MDLNKALNKLKKGNDRFVNSLQINHAIGVTENTSLVSSQNPFVVVLACSDSRVGVNTIFDTKLGDIFLVKNAGNIVDKTTLATMEYAIVELGVKLIVVLSHQNCGAVEYAKTHPNKKLGKEYNLDFLLHQIREVVVRDKDASFKDMVIANANYSAEKITENSIIISDQVGHSNVKIVTGYYNIATGKVSFK